MSRFKWESMTREQRKQFLRENYLASDRVDYDYDRLHFTTKEQLEKWDILTYPSIWNQSKKKKSDDSLTLSIKTLKSDIIAWADYTVSGGGPTARWIITNQKKVNDIKTFDDIKKLLPDFVLDYLIKRMIQNKLNVEYFWTKINIEDYKITWRT